MKKLLSVLLVLALVLSLCACAGNNDPAEENEIGALLREGYQCTTSTYNDEVWKGLFQKDGGFDVVYRADVKLTADEIAEIEALDFADENYDSKWERILKSFANVTVTDISDTLPTQEELNAFVGKTFGELEDAGYENTGSWGSDGDFGFYYDGPIACVIAKPAVGTVTDLDDLSANALRELVIDTIEFSSISSTILDD